MWPLRGFGNEKGTAERQMVVALAKRSFLTITDPFLRE